MNKKSLFLKMLGLLLLISPFFINHYSLIRLGVLLFGGLLFSLGIFLFKKPNVVKIVLYPLLLLFLFYGIDYTCVFFLKRVPIFAYENVMEINFSTFDSLIYRIYNCDGEKTFDSFYKLGYVCDYTLEEKDINAFLSSGNNNYQKYRSKFITVKGKVSEVFGNEYLNLQAYEQNENSLVGQLIFNKNATLKIVNNQGDLKLYNNYEIYDNVLVTGRIVKKENTEIIMYDAKIQVINNFDDFAVNTIEAKSCQNNIKKLTTVGEYTFYSNCLDEIFIKYDEDTVYDIILALETKKLTFDKWIRDSSKEEDDEKELYQFANYNLLKCKDSNTIVIGNKKMKLNSKLCETIKD